MSDERVADILMEHLTRVFIEEERAWREYVSQKDPNPWDNPRLKGLMKMLTDKTVYGRVERKVGL